MKESRNVTRKTILTELWMEKKIEEREREMGECLSILQDPELSRNCSIIYVHTALHATCVSGDIGMVQKLKEQANRIRDLNPQIFYEEIDSQLVSSPDNFCGILHGSTV